MILLRPPPLAWGQAAQPLRLEKTIELPEVQGRIDHLSVDVKGQRLFVSALGNNTVEVIDLKAGKRLKTISGLREPQGVLYVPATDRLYVANAKDGSVQVFDGSSYALIKTLDYGDDADNLRYDAGRKRIYVGYGGGALGEIDEENNKAGEIKLDAHPESFQLEKDSPQNLCKSTGVAKSRRSRPGKASGNRDVVHRNGAVELSHGARPSQTTGCSSSPGFRRDCLYSIQIRGKSFSA